VSGGLDSAVLLGESAQVYPVVYPLYVRTGLAWEEVELAHLGRFLAGIARASLQPLQILDQPVADLYGKHWSMTGFGVPDAQTPDEAVFLPGRNALLLCKALLWCHLNAVSQLALGILEANPFPDATPQFFKAFTSAINMAVLGEVTVLTPYTGLPKIEVVHRGKRMPLQETFSCINPKVGKHCGQCNKCAERQKAFVDSGIADPTYYNVR
jgi:7-cyano-7-deazaguanine synthase